MIKIKKIAKLSKKEGIYSNKDLSITFAFFPSTLPLPFCITNGITLPTSERSFAFVSFITFLIKSRVSSSDNDSGRYLAKMSVSKFSFSARPYRILCYHVIPTEIVKTTETG